MTTLTLSRARGRQTLVAGCATHFLVFWHMTVTISSSVDLRLGLASSPAQASWPLVAYSLPVAVLLLSGGAVGGRVGWRRALRWGSALVCGGALLVASAPLLTVVLIGQVGCGVGVALLVPASLGAIGEAFPDPSSRTRAISVWVTAAGAGLVVGPLSAGALLVLTMSWRAPYGSSAALAVVVMLLAGGVTGPSTPGRKPDLVGQSLAAGSLVALVLAVAEAGASRRPAVLVALIAIGVAAAVLFAAVERGSGSPSIPIALLRDRRFLAAVVVTGVGLSGFVGLVLVHVVSYQQSDGLSAWQVALRLSPATVGFALSALAGGRWSSARGARGPAVAGLLTAAVGAAVIWAAAATGEPSPAQAAAVMGLALVGAGSGLVLAPATAAAVVHVEPALAPVASAIVNAARQMGAVLGASVLGSVLAARLSSTGAAGPSREDFQAGLQYAAALTALVLVGTALLAWRHLHQNPSPSAASAGGPATRHSR